MRPITALVVHCSATPAGKPFRAADIDRWHREKGWAGIGYHFVIPLDGSVEPGRPLAEAGAHVEGHNRDTIGICLIGGVDATGKPAATFNERQYDALELQLRALRGRFPQAHILGHRDFPGVVKACPSFDVRAWCRTRGLDPK
ncbi:N-acetylmuramoyl-L-alanine amidase [Lysobacter sp. K5869]|uniref:N-acetylmuramoyl-L-alanine amidase n=1 Tax=Lysobacter sp. K5869 TaxID=2820808 RepID=UPI001C0646FF|nr:N-acetylmuramoyl-L-alanine amidase [Lysobacter sp. K5869]QWP79216.1 N-acetylmuramoyl-L-alanine amidase [Lysobacter sp. K5869]